MPTQDFRSRSTAVGIATGRGIAIALAFTDDSGIDDAGGGAGMLPVQG